MKNIFSAILLMLPCLYSYSQKLDAKKVPQEVKNAFTKAHPNANPAWEREDASYEANFKEGGKIMSCVIDKQGTILETESAIAATELPAAARTYMNQHYKGKKWKEVTRIVKADGNMNYEVNIGTDVLFDAKGNHLEKKEEKEKD
jgi:Putative beta-lactamase-inhibitor-like, PepSY-like